MTQLKVALNISALPVSDKITQSQTMITNIASHPQEFPNPGSVLTNASTAVNNLQAAMLDAADGGKSKTAIMHDREDELVTAMNRLGAYVESVANGDPAVAPGGYGREARAFKSAQELRCVPERYSRARVVNDRVAGKNTV